MNRFVAALALLAFAAPTVAHAAAAKPMKAPKAAAAKLSDAQRIKLAVKFASTKPAFSGDPGAIFTGWNAGASSLPVVAKTGSVRVSSGDEQSPQFANYFVTFGKRGKLANKPNKLVFINTAD
jgi:hypothetical protein